MYELGGLRPSVVSWETGKDGTPVKISTPLDAEELRQLRAAARRRRRGEKTAAKAKAGRA